MKLSARQLAYLCWALEEAPAETAEEEEQVSDLLSLFSSSSPFSPYRSARAWREAHT
jgi:hypothetical protein